jgi:hypothetical protein
MKNFGSSTARIDLLQKSNYAPPLPPAPNPQRGPQVPQRGPHAPPILGGEYIKVPQSWGASGGYAGVSPSGAPGVDLGGIPAFMQEV